MSDGRAHPADLAVRRRLRHLARGQHRDPRSVVRGRLNATSVMVVAPSFDRAEAVSLDMLNAGAHAGRDRPACHADRRRSGR